MWGKEYGGKFPPAPQVEVQNLDYSFVTEYIRVKERPYIELKNKTFVSVFLLTDLDLLNSRVGPKKKKTTKNSINYTSNLN